MNVSKISMLSNSPELRKSEKGVKAQGPAVNFMSSPNNVTMVSNQQLANALRASSTVSFGRFDPKPSAVVVDNFEAFIPNVFKVKQNIAQPKSGEKDQNSAFAIYTGWDNSKKVRTTCVKLDGDRNPSIKIKKGTSSSKLPEAKLKVGKFAPMVELIDRELGMKIQVLQGATVRGNSYSVVNSGPVKTGEETRNISFKGLGEAQVVTYNQEQTVQDASERYLSGDMQSKVAKGDFIDLMQEYPATFMVLAGGYGTRLYDYTSCKPAAVLPTDPNYTLMCNALDQIAKANVDLNEFIYLTGKGSLTGDNVRTNIQRRNLGDGGCIAQSLANKKTSTNEPLIILNADTITNADITRAYEAYRRNPDAAILIPYYESPENRAKDFGLMKANSVGNGTLEIESFVEKPKTLKEAAPAKIEGKDKYMANPGIYIIGPEALKELKKMGVDLKNNPREIGLAKDFITPLVEKCQAGEFKDADGNAMKCYTTLLEKKGGGAAFWDDLGKAVTIPEVFRYMAKETSEHGADSPDNLFYGLPEFMLNDAVKNVDLDTGAVFMNDEAREKFAKFKEKYGAELYGNCIVYSSIDDAA